MIIINRKKIEQILHLIKVDKHNLSEQELFSWKLLKQVIGN